MIFITGATGHLGNAVIQFLLERMTPNDISALVRTSSKAVQLRSKNVQVRTGDYDDYPSLVKAFAGIDKLFFISGSDVAKRGKQHENIIKAAKETGIKHIFYTSFQRKTEDLSSPIALIAKVHIETEKNLISSGIPYTILRNSLYMDGMPAFIGNRVLETGNIIFPAGDGKISCVLRKEMAEASANILAGKGHENKIYEFSSPISYSFYMVADYLSELSGKKITYSDTDPEDYKKILTKAGVSEDSINFSTLFASAIKHGEFDHPDKALEILLERKPLHMKDFLKGHYMK